MSTFTFACDFDSSQSNEPRVRKSQFTDGGYEHRIRFGLNTDPNTFSVLFQSRTDSEADQIVAFFKDAGGAEAFDWTFAPSARRNLLTFTDDFSQPIWTRFFLTSIGANLVGYAGGSNAFSLVANATNNLHYVEQQIAVPANTNTTTSLYVKKGLGRDVQMHVYGTTDYHGVSFNMVTNTPSLITSGSPTTTSWGAVQVGSDGWWRLWITGRPDNGTIRLPKIFVTNASGTLTFTGDASSTYLQIMGPQVEYGGLTGYQPIAAAPPAPKYVCERWDRQFVSCDKNNITATFRQVFES